jgi:hypothetical protein
MDVDRIPVQGLRGQRQACPSFVDQLSDLILAGISEE